MGRVKDLSVFVLHEAVMFPSSGIVNVYDSLYDVECFHKIN
jgi:hypothetical protein